MVTTIELYNQVNSIYGLGGLLQDFVKNMEIGELCNLYDFFCNLTSRSITNRKFITTSYPESYYLADKKITFPISWINVETLVQHGGEIKDFKTLTISIHTYNRYGIKKFENLNRFIDMVYRFAQLSKKHGKVNLIRVYFTEMSRAKSKIIKDELDKKEFCQIATTVIALNVVKDDYFLYNEKEISPIHIRFGCIKL